MNLKSHILASVMALSAMVGSASAATFAGAFYDVGGRSNFSDLTSVVGSPTIENIIDALNHIGSYAADATFTSSGISYNMTAPHNMPADLGAFLGGDAASLSSDAATPFLGTILTFSGTIKLLAGVNKFDVFSDDGFAMFIDGTEVNRFEGLRAPSSSAFDVTSTGGNAAFKLVFFEGSQSQAALQVKLNGNVLAAVPLPAGGLLLIGAIGGLAALRRRRNAAV